LENKQETIHQKGFDMTTLNYNTTKVGVKQLTDAIMILGDTKKINRIYGDKNLVLQALGNRDTIVLRKISNYFFNTNGIYRRICEYFAYLYRYDWYIVPEIFDATIKQEKVLKDFSKVLTYLDNSHIPKICGDIALKVIKNGAYYGLLVDSNE